LYSLLGYASDALGDESIYRMPVTHYYFRYFLALMSPLGVIPDFGDADWGGGSERMIPFFEKGAAVYHDPELRWAAARLFERVGGQNKNRPSVYLGMVASDACRWADFSVPAKRPETRSQMVLEDVVGKKAVFRNGWDSSSTYLLYTYRDEGDGGWLFREYLRTTIPVEEEKMHHGHSDENSIPLLMSKGSILLHDGGYRDYMPSGPYGAFRADYFHNRIVVRDGKIALGQKAGQRRYASPGQAAVPGQSMLDFFREAGSYRSVRTHHVDFLSLTHYDMIRSRLTDDHRGYVGDRSIVYVKDLDLFVVFDCVRFSRENYLTMANLWHTRKIFASGPGWYDTGYDSLRTVDVRGDQRLLIHFPYRERLEEGVEQQRRYYQEEQTIYQMIGRHGYPNAQQVFVTVLIPHPANQDPGELAKTVRMLDVSTFPRAAGVTISREGKTYLVGVKFDLESELADDWRRPMYSYESGATKFGDYETDAYHLFVVEDQSTLTYTMAGGVQISYKGRLLHKQQPSTSSLRFDGGPDFEGTGKVRYWEEMVKK
jgi:hypothetical protein